VSAKAERFIVVSVGDTDGDGYDEHTLPVLLRLVDSHFPDHRRFTHTGVVGCFRTSRQKLETVRTLILEAERLRSEDSRFGSLKIGFAEGELIGEFDRRGRVISAMLLGGAIAEAVASERASTDQKAKLESISRSLYAGNA
jgi:hypothetical protein